MSRALLSISFGVSSTIVPLQGPLTELRQRERCPIPRALLHSSFNIPGIRAPFQVPHWGPYEETRLQTLFYTTFRVPSTGDPSRFLSQSAHRQRCSISKALPQLSPRVPDKRTPPPCVPTGSLWREVAVSRAFFYT